MNECPPRHFDFGEIISQSSLFSFGLHFIDAQRELKPEL